MFIYCLGASIAVDALMMARMDYKAEKAHLIRRQERRLRAEHQRAMVKLLNEARDK